MKSPGYGDRAPFFRMTVFGVVSPRSLDGTFNGFNAGIGEKDPVSKAAFRQPYCQFFLIWNLEQIRCMPKFASLFRQSRNEVWMGVSQGTDGDATTEIEISVAVGSEQLHTFSEVERDREAGVCIQHGGISGGHGDSFHICCEKKARRRREAGASGQEETAFFSV